MIYGNGEFEGLPAMSYNLSIWHMALTNRNWRCTGVMVHRVGSRMLRIRNPHNSHVTVSES